MQHKIDFILNTMANLPSADYQELAPQVTALYVAAGSEWTNAVIKAVYKLFQQLTIGPV